MGNRQLAALVPVKNSTINWKVSGNVYRGGGNEPPSISFVKLTHRSHNSFARERNCGSRLEDRHCRTSRRTIAFADGSFHASVLEPEWAVPDNLIPEASLLYTVSFTAPSRPNFKGTAIRFEFCEQKLNIVCQQKMWSLNSDWNVQHLQIHLQLSRYVQASLKFLI